MSAQAGSGQNRIVIDWERAWLAAMIDAEGYVSPPKQTQRRVTISNQNVFVLFRVAEILERIGVQFSARFDRRDKTVSIAMYGGKPHGSNFARLHAAVGDYLVSWKRDNLRHLAVAPTQNGGGRGIA